MLQKNRVYVAIDLKSFYASVECAERGLDPLTTNLVVADAARTEKTICLAVSPSLRAWGIPGRARLFEVVQKVREINARRRLSAPGHVFEGSSYDDAQLKDSPGLSLSYVTAPPRMALYMEYSTKIYNIYLKYIAPEDIHVYSIDEVFMDVTDYLHTYRLDARGLAKKIMQEVLQDTGITATAGIGDNLYLCKVALDIMAKHVAPDEDGVRIGELDEMAYRRMLWTHRPLTDFWRVGRGYARKLEENGIFTMGDVARCSLGRPEDFYNEELLYRLFGINAELLIDHAWGWEPCTIKEVKAYRPENSSLGSGQVLQCPYSFEKGKLIVREMADLLALDLVDKGLVADQVVLTIGYDIENLTNPEIKRKYKGPVTTDHYGRRVPKHAHGTRNLNQYTSSTKLILDAVTKLYEEITDKNLLVRRVNVTVNHVIEEKMAVKEEVFEQLDLFTDYEARQKEKEEEHAESERERRLQMAMLDIKKKYGKNAILKGMNLEEGAMTMERNRQIGGHRA
ncbi:DNA methylase [Lachnospiraceae bacterium]|jgi:DNA polymerase V|nr:DNA methylase [Lachnospiraceae bacterium]